jgi:hypothetical protein
MAADATWATVIEYFDYATFRRGYRWELGLATTVVNRSLNVSVHRTSFGAVGHSP